MPRRKAPAPKTNERSHGQGSIREIRPGVYRAWMPPQADGKRPSKTFDGPEALRRAEWWIAGSVPIESLRLGEYLELWYAARQPALSRQTRRGYEAAMKHAGDLSGRPLASITTMEWQHWLGQLLAQGTECWRWEGRGEARCRVPTGERRPMAVTSVKSIRSVLSIALNDAVPDYLTHNPLKRTRLPQSPPAPAKAWTQREIAALLVAAVGTRDEAMYHVGLAVGPRLGELRELRWSDLDVDTGLLQIERSLSDDGKVVGPTKTRRRRTVQLPPETMAILLAHGKRQQPGESLMFGAGGRSYSAVEYRRMLTVVCAAAGVTRLTIHALRHTAASIQLADRVAVPEVARMLGHTVAVCLKTYGHFIGDDSSRAVAAARLALYGAGTESSPSARALHAAS